MKVVLKPGKYIVAVSGGVDSIVLLHMLVQQFQSNNQAGDYVFVVAHFDHGIRKDSAEDAHFVESLAKKNNLDAEIRKGNLGASASEESARNARYAFLNDMKKKHGADRILTAHHQDDVIETVCINIVRGTGRKGLTSLRSTENLARPLLQFSKRQILLHAKRHQLMWREDSTNVDTSYLRNYIRANIVPRLTQHDRKDLLSMLHDLRATNDAIDTEVVSLLQMVSQGNKINRYKLIMLPHTIACELIILWLARNQITNMHKKQIEILVVKSKTASFDKKFNIIKDVFIEVGEKYLALTRTDR